MKLYSGVRRFLAIPTNFRGVGEPGDGHFQTLVPRSAHLFGAVYKEAEILLNDLESFRVKWLPLVAPAKIDIGQTYVYIYTRLWVTYAAFGVLRKGRCEIWCVILGFGDYCRLKGKQPQDWEKAFKDAKQWAQEVTMRGDSFD